MKKFVRNALLTLSCLVTTQLTAETFDHDIEVVAYFPYHCTNELMVHLKKIFHPKVFIETGTLGGTTAFAAAQVFPEVHTVELSDHHYQRVAKMNKHTNLTCHHGNSYEVLEKILPSISGTKLFWLDAHFSGGNTATLRDKNGRAISPLQDEVRVILENGLEDSIILIDDICGYSFNKEDTAEGPGSRFSKILSLLNAHQLTYYIMGDLLIAYDATYHQPRVSPLVELCTKSRLFNGYNSSKAEVEQVLRTEKAIAVPNQTQEHSRLSYIATRCSSREYRFFRGLVNLGAKNYRNAAQDFQDAIDRGYEHWRVKFYLAYAQKRARQLAQSKETLSRIKEEAAEYQELLDTLYP